MRTHILNILILNLPSVPRLEPANLTFTAGQSQLMSVAVIPPDDITNADEIYFISLILTNARDVLGQTNTVQVTIEDNGIYLHLMKYLLAILVPCDPIEPGFSH